MPESDTVPSGRCTVRRRIRRPARAHPVARAQVGGTGELATLDVELNRIGFVVGRAVFGIGAGLLPSQLEKVIMSSVEPAKTNEADGLQWTAQNHDASLGTVLIGAVLLTGLTTGFMERMSENAAVPAELRERPAPRRPPPGRAGRAGRSARSRSRPAARPGRGGRGGLRRGPARRPLARARWFAVLGFWFTRRLPSRPDVEVAPASEARPGVAG